jgi:hypothetical protein
MVESYTERLEHRPVSGRHIFKDEFADLNAWDTITGTPAVASGILSVDAGGEIRTKRKFSCGCLVVKAKSDAAPSLQVGFDGGDVNYAVVSNGYLRTKSTSDPVEGTTTVTFTETNYNTFVLFWSLDSIIIWVNGGIPTINQNIKIPDRALPISIKNIGAGTVNVTAVAVYPEPVFIEPLNVGSGTSGTQQIATLSYISGAANYGVFIYQRAMSTPYTDSTTPLGAGATFTGTSRDVQYSATSYIYFDGIRAVVTADQAGTLYIDESPDNSTWILGLASVAVGANEVKTLSHKVTCRYVRVRYVNDGSAQGTFKLYSRVVGSNP